MTACRKDGSTFMGELSIGEVDHPGSYTVILRNISERKLAEEFLRVRRDLSEQFIESAPNIVMVLDLEGRIVRVNPTFEKLTGRTKKEIEGEDWFDHFVPVRNRKKNRALFHSLLTGPPLVEYIDPIIAKDNEEKFIEWNAAHLTDADGINTGLLCTGNDVTDRLRLEGEVISAVEEDRRWIAQELHDGVGSLLTGINFHLGALKEKVEAQTPLDPSEIEAVASLVGNAIDQSRNIAKGIHPIGADPEELVSALGRLISRMDGAHSALCRFICEPPVLLEDPVVANQLFRITQEAVNNAVKHSGAKSITVTLTKTADRIRVEIDDDGDGFDPDSQSPEGLGLHIMHYRTRAISGTLTVTSTPGKGTRVVCSVPIPEKPRSQ
jgi:PAS domain S-box-containing protein